MEFTHRTIRKIKSPRPLGEILKNARKKKELTLEQAEEETKVRARYLESLEEGKLDDLPETVYTIGFLTKYAEFLGLDKENMIAQFNQERGRVCGPSRLMVERRIKEPILQITPKLIVIVVIILALAGILGYIGFSVRGLTAPPNLEIASPTSSQIVTSDEVEIIGKTDEGVTITINNQPVTLDKTGNFRQAVKLNPGLNSFEIRAINSLKKENVKVVKVLAEFTEVQPSATNSSGGLEKETQDVTDQ